MYPLNRRESWMSESDKGVQVIEVWIIAVLGILGFTLGSAVALVLFARLMF